MAAQVDKPMSHLNKGLPFKGKGGLAWSSRAARKRLVELADGLWETVRQMERLTREFQTEFRPPWPVHPVLQRVAGGRVYVRWRLPGARGQQPYIELASEPGQVFIEGLSRPVQAAYRRYWRVGLELNLAHAVALAEWIRLRQFVADLDQWPGADKAIVGQGGTAHGE